MQNISKITLTLLFAALSCTAVSATAATRSASAETAPVTQTLRSNPFEETYMTGETLNISSPDSDGVVVTYPSGVSVGGDSITLTEPGRYTVSYISAAADGTSRREEYTFVAAERLYSVSSSLSSVGYGHTLQNYEITADAVLASVASRDRFEYRPMIDLNELAGSEFIEFFVTPEVIGTADAMKIQVMLTDAYDEDNFVVISVKKGTAAQEGAAWAELNSYITANAVGQVPAGLEKGQTGITVYGNEYRLQKGTVWGANVRFALPGNPAYASAAVPNNDPDKVASQSLKLSLDNATGDIYANGQLVSVLKNSEIYGDTLWSGFTTGECYLSVYGENFNSAALGLGIKSLGGVVLDGETENIFIDSVCPSIDVDFCGEPSVPDAVAGKPYSLFPATADDDYSGTCAVNAEVYYGYGTENEVRLNVSDNAFCPFRAGDYTILYRALDRYGNESVKTVEVKAYPADTALVSATAAAAADGAAGAVYTINAPDFVNAHGNVRWRAVATLEGGSEVSYEISSEDMCFVPEYAGRYTLTYIYSDYISGGTLQKTFDVSASRKPVIDGVPVFPRYLMLGCEYPLEELSGTVYTDGTPVDKTCEIYVREDGGDERRLNGGKLVTYAQNYVEIIYRISDGDGCEIVSDKIPVVDVGYNGVYKIENYFAGEEFTATTNKDYIRFVADKAESNSAGLTFVNALQTFDFSFRAYASGNGFTTMNVVLTDSRNDGVSVMFTYRNSSGNVYFSVNGGEETLLAGASFNNSGAPLYLWYNGTDNLVMPTGVSSLAIPVTADMSGAAFNGFEDMSAYMTVELSGITDAGSASLNIVNISGQRISNIYTDTTKPKLSATTASGDRVQGTEYTIPKVYAGDVLDVVRGSMSVTAPDGNYAVSKDGVELNGVEISREYTLLLEQFGAYTVTYEVSDISGNKLVYEYVLRSADFTPPEVSVISPLTEASVGSAVKVADISVKDNKDKSAEDFTVFVTITTPEFRSYSLMGADGSCAATFTAPEAGVYTVTYLVIDTSGNMTQVSYKVNVK